jgi:hypothetical protein
MSTVSNITLIPGWAFKSNEKELSEKNYHRYDEIKDSKDITITRKVSSYGHFVCHGICKPGTDAEDIAIFCDRGNVCFGASVIRLNSSAFECRVNTD